MDTERELYFRRHTRLRDFDYTANRAYFITIVTRRRECVFGQVAGHQVRLSRRGLVVQGCWHDIPVHHSQVELDAFVVLPNHLHGILMFTGAKREATQASQLQKAQTVAATPASPRAHGPAGGSLSAVVGSFKSAVSRQINHVRSGAPSGLWQPNFYDHVIRSDRALEIIRDYIVTNPQRWQDDQENPAGTGTDDLCAFVESLAVPHPPREATQPSQLQGEVDA